MKTVENIPFAPNLVESMRSIGYSFHTAIADLIDNSVGALAKRIDLIQIPSEKPSLIILDDGYGMSKDELELALKFGSKNPLEQRRENDLGRFGLGMKSASLSQCRKLTVASKKNNEISCYSWDIDYINERKSWALIELEKNEIKSLPQIEELEKKDHGTYLLLENFDRVASTTENLAKTLSEYMNNTIEHLGLIFHRFMEKGLKIYVNNNLIEPYDPFLKNNKCTQELKKNIITIDNYKITVEPFVLPHISKLTPKEISRVGGIDNLKNKQGFYIYRNDRLIIEGEWFRLYRKEELSKLVRIKVDIPKELDYMWGIDVKKSNAIIPDVIKKNLIECIDIPIRFSKRVHEYRGRKTQDSDINYVWERFENRNKNISYRINRDLPQLKLLTSKLDNCELKLLNNFFNLLEDNIPNNQIYLDVANNVYEQSSNEIEELVFQIKEMLDLAVNLNYNKEEFLRTILSTEPYSNFKEIENILKERHII